MPGKPTSKRHLDDSVIEHMDGLYSYALMLSRNRNDAEDLVQETYVRAIPAMARLRGRSNLKSWLFTILRNLWLNQLRQRRRDTLGARNRYRAIFHGYSCRGQRRPIFITPKQNTSTTST